MNLWCVLQLWSCWLDIPCLCKQCRSRSVGFFRSQQIWICTVCIKYLNLYQQPWSSNLIGWKLEVGMVSYLNLFSTINSVDPILLMSNHNIYFLWAIWRISAFFFFLYKNVISWAIDLLRLKDKHSNLPCHAGPGYTLPSQTA